MSRLFDSRSRLRWSTMPLLAALALGLLAGQLAGRRAAAQTAETAGHAGHGPAAGAAAMAATGELVEYQLTVQPGKWEIAPGIVVDAWTYNGQVPGPELRAREGDLVRVVVTNRLPVPTTIHWHGIDVPNAMDGVPGITQQPIMPGETFVYEFPATNPGTRWYHSHQDANTQLELGLYGAFIIEHREDPNGHFDRDYTILLDEKALDFTPAVAMGRAQLRHAEFGNGRGGNFEHDLFLINGKAGNAIPPIDLKEGERVRLRIISVGNLVHSMHTHGHSFKLIATDGNPIHPNAQWLKDVVTVGPGERYDVEFVGHNAGVWLFHCHMPNHGDGGMMTTIRYEGVEPPVGFEMTHSGPAHVAPPASAAPAATPTPTAPAAAGTPTLPGQTAAAGPMVDVLDNRFEPRELRIRAGTTVAWRNRGINLHTSTSFDGLWDGPLAPGESFSFTFARPGTYNYFCRQHVLQGQFGQIVVE